MQLHFVCSSTLVRVFFHHKALQSVCSIIREKATIKYLSVMMDIQVHVQICSLLEYSLCQIYRCPYQISISDHYYEKTVTIDGIQFAASGREAQRMYLCNSLCSLVNFDMWPTGNMKNVSLYSVSVYVLFSMQCGMWQSHDGCRLIMLKVRSLGGIHAILHTSL